MTDPHIYSPVVIRHQPVQLQAPQVTTAITFLRFSSKSLMHKQANVSMFSYFFPIFT